MLTLPPVSLFFKHNLRRFLNTHILNHQTEKPLTIITYHEIFMCVEYRKFFLKDKEIKKLTNRYRYSHVPNRKTHQVPLFYLTTINLYMSLLPMFFFRNWGTSNIWYPAANAAIINPSENQ